MSLGRTRRPLGALPITLPAPDGSRDPRIEDPSNRWLIHLTGRLLLPWALRLGLSANIISVGGFALGIGAATAYRGWHHPAQATLGFLLCIAWLIADGLDGMVARATKTASPLGRFLDGLCDHGVFLLLYLAVLTSWATTPGWLLGVTAGLFHAVQSSLFEGERMRFHRRIRGQALPLKPSAANPLVRLYDSVANSLDRLAEPFDRVQARAVDPVGLGETYGTTALGPMRLMVLLSNNLRVLTLYLACLAGSPELFFWFEIGPLTIIGMIAMVWHRRVEHRLAALQAD